MPPPRHHPLGMYPTPLISPVPPTPSNLPNRFDPIPQHPLSISHTPRNPLPLSPAETPRAEYTQSRLKGSARIVVRVRLLIPYHSTHG